MAKREFIDKAMMLREYGDILDCDINHLKYEITVRDIIEEANETTEQKIVKPYLENLKKQIRYDYNRNIWRQYEYEKVMDLINNLLSEQEG